MIVVCVFLFNAPRQLYVQDMKNKRGKLVNDKRDMNISEEDDLDFFKTYCQRFFGTQEDPWDVDEDLLAHIWEEIKLEGVTCYHCCLNCFSVCFYL